MTGTTTPVVHKYEGRYGLVVWPADAKRWRGRENAPPAQECVTIRWESLPPTAGARYRPRGRYIIRFHLDGLEMRMHPGALASWLEAREGRRMDTISVGGATCGVGT